MSEIITFPLPVGTNYVIPDVGDENWGQNVTDFLVAIPSGVMPTSGTFSLTGDVSFGPTFGLVSQYFKTATTIPATAGFLRLSKTDSIDWRNNANSANLSLSLNGSDNLTFGGARVLIPTVSVPDGGTGATAFTAYSVLCGGTTSAAPLQNVSGVGLSGQFLQSQGAGMLPVWANAAGTGTVNSGIAGNLSLYPATTNAVSDTYVQNTKNITVGIASQSGRTVDLALTIPNPGNAVSAASIVLTQGGQTLTGPYTFGTNQVTFPNGSALLPSICFSGSNTTGFDFTAGTIQVAISAAQVFQFTGSENRSYQPLSMQTQKIINLADPTLAQDATTKTYVDSNISSSITTAVNAAITGTINTLSKFTSTHVIGDSGVTDDGTTVAVTSRLLNQQYPVDMQNPTSQYNLRLRDSGTGGKLYHYTTLVSSTWASATTIAIVGAGANGGGEMLIHGNQTSGAQNTAFCDKIQFVWQGNSATVTTITSVVVGSPIARTYTITAASGTATIKLQMVANGATYQTTFGMVALFQG